MKRRYVPLVMILVFAFILSWNTVSVIRAQMNINAVLLAYGQTPIPLWRPVIRGTPIIPTLKIGQADLYKNERMRLMSDIKYAEAQSAGFHISVKDPDAPNGSILIPKEDYLTQAAIDLAKLDAHIALLE